MTPTFVDKDRLHNELGLNIWVGHVYRQTFTFSRSILYVWESAMNILFYEFHFPNSLPPIFQANSASVSFHPISCFPFPNSVPPIFLANFRLLISICACVGVWFDIIYELVFQLYRVRLSLLLYGLEIKLQESFFRCGNTSQTDLLPRSHNHILPT